MSSNPNSDSPPMAASAPENAPSRKRRTGSKLVVLGIFLTAAIVLYAKYGDSLSLQGLAAREGDLRGYQVNAPATVFGIGFALYVAVTGLSLPGAAALTLVFGWFFGLAQGLLLVSFASSAGATVAFLFSRFLLRDSIEAKFGERLKGFNEALQREGAFYLFTLRLIPAVPFFVINLVMGLTALRTWTFWWVSQLGMLPGTIVFVYAGSQFPSLEKLAESGAKGILTPQLFLAFALLGIFPIVVKKIMAAVTKKTSTEA